MKKPAADEREWSEERLRAALAAEAKVAMKVTIWSQRLVLKNQLAIMGALRLLLADRSGEIAQARKRELDEQRTATREALDK